MPVVKPKKLFVKRFVTPPLVVLAALVMGLEEWLWEYVKVLTARLSRLKAIQRCESWLASLAPYPTLGIFFLPGLALLPLKVFALWLLAHASKVAGIALIVVAKFVGTALTARTFVIGKPKLMSIPWFARLHDAIVGARLFLYRTIAAMSLFQRVKRTLGLAKQAIGRFMRQGQHRSLLLERWRAVRRRQKKALARSHGK